MKDDLDLFQRNLTKHAAKIDTVRTIGIIAFALYSNRENWPLMESGKLPNRSNWDMARAEEYGRCLRRQNP